MQSRRMTECRSCARYRSSGDEDCMYSTNFYSFRTIVSLEMFTNLYQSQFLRVYCRFVSQFLKPELHQFKRDIDNWFCSEIKSLHVSVNKWLARMQLQDLSPTSRPAGHDDCHWFFKLIKHSNSCPKFDPIFHHQTPLSCHPNNDRFPPHFPLQEHSPGRFLA